MLAAGPHRRPIRPRRMPGVTVPHGRVNDMHLISAASYCDRARTANMAVVGREAVRLAHQLLLEPCRRGQLQAAARLQVILPYFLPTKSSQVDGGRHTPDYITINKILAGRILAFVGVCKHPTPIESPSMHVPPNPVMTVVCGHPGWQSNWLRTRTVQHSMSPRPPFSSSLQ